MTTARPYTSFVGLYTISPKDATNKLSGLILSSDSAFKRLGHCAMPQLWDAL